MQALLCLVWPSDASNKDIPEDSTFTIILSHPILRIHALSVYTDGLTCVGSAWHLRPRAYMHALVNLFM